MIVDAISQLKKKHNGCTKLNILMLTTHMYDSKKRAGFHHLAKSFLGMGQHVTFCTVPNSILELLSRKTNNQIRYNRCLSAYRAFAPQTRGKLTKTSYSSLLHSYKGFKCLNVMAHYIYLHGYSKIFSKTYDVIIFESSVGLFFFDKLKMLNPTAKLVYRVSDDLELIGGSKELIDYEARILPKFDLISSPSLLISEKIRNKAPNVNIITQYHGIDKNLFDANYNNPYNKKKKNFVFVGTGFMDQEFLKISMNINQDWVFHIIGNLPRKIINANIHYYGEMPFDETIPYIKFADAGLQIRSKSKGIETLEKSLKFIQYTYLKLPIIAPKYMHLTDSHVCSYEHTRKSIEDAINQALVFSHEIVDRSIVLSWDEIAKEMLTCAKSKSICEIDS